MNDLLIPAGACLSVVLIFAVLGVVAVKMSKKSQAAWRAVSERTGLYYEHKGVYPKLEGRLHGADLMVDVMTQQVASSSEYGPRNRAWTRVRAQLDDPPQIQVRSRQQKHKVGDDWQSVKTGNPAFDDVYELFVPNGVSPKEVFPKSVELALLAANPPVHIMNNVVLWTKLRVVRDPDLLVSACESCSRVAAALSEYE